MEIDFDRAVTIGLALVGVGSYWGAFRGWRRSVNRRMKRFDKRVDDVEKTLAKALNRDYVPRFGDDDDES